MAKAQNFIPKDDPQFFPEQNGIDSRGVSADRFTLRSPDAANTNEKDQPWIDTAPAVEESEVWSRYEPSGSAMFDKPDISSKNVHSSSRWLVRGAVAAFFIVGVGMAALNYNSRAPAKPAAVEETATAAPAPIVQSPRDAMADTTALADPAAAPAATAPVKAEPGAKTPAPKAVALVKSNAADAAAAPTYSGPPAAAPSTAIAPNSPAATTDTLPPIMPQATAPSAPTAAAPADPAAPPPTLTPAPVPGSAQTIPEITPGNEPMPQ